MSSDNISLGVTILLADPKISAACVPSFVSMEKEKKKKIFRFWNAIHSLDEGRKFW